MKQKPFYQVFEAINLLIISFSNYIYIVLLISPRHAWWMHVYNLKIFYILNSIDEKYL